jgi:tetratricopeptide (TPR) repeat protein
MTCAAACWLVLGVAPLPSLAAGAADDKKKVDVAVVFLTEMNIAETTIEVGPLSRWVKPIIEAIEARFRDEAGRRTVVVQVTLHPKGPARVEVAGKPAPSDDEVKALLKVADPARAPRTKVVDCSFRVVAKINGGHPDEGLPLSPRIETPDERRLAGFRAASTAERLALLRRWARAEALPILAASAAHAEAKFEGVRGLGRAIGRLDPDRPVDVAALTERNPDYWRALLEMAPGNPLVPAAHIALHVANGEIDRARRIAQAIDPFDANKSGPSRLLAEFRMMMGPFYKDVETRIGEGVALHDKGRFDQALKVYDAILKDYPGSAWAHYERFHTRRAAALQRGESVEQAHAGWPEARAAILACDPLYPTMALATGAVEQYHLIRRMEINDLFKDRDAIAKDLVRYADIALDLEAYGFAAMLYWNIVCAIKPADYGDRELVEYFLYCLERLGVKGLKENFRGDHAAEFARIKAERRKLMEENPAFRKGKKEKSGGPDPPGPEPSRDEGNPPDRGHHD